MKFHLSAVALASVLARSSAVNEDLYELVKDIYPGETSSNPIGLTLYDDMAYFAATGPDTGVELYVSDGTSDGTDILKDINPGSGSSNPSQFTEFKGKLYFRANDGDNGVELWVTDGTESGTELFMDINSGEASSNPADFVVLGSVMVFEATTDDAGKELWVTDGTTTGTKLLKDINSGSDGSGLELRSNYKLSDGTLVFAANDGQNGQSLYATDGTSDGTILLKAISGNATSVIGRPMEEADEIFFTVGTDLWVTDGTKSGTKLVKSDVNVGGPSRISGYVLNGKTLFYGRNEGEEVDNLWETDGTSSGTKVLFTALESPEKSRGGSSTFGLGFGPVINDKISLITDNGSGVNIWVTDGDNIELLMEDVFDWVLDVKPSKTGEQALFLIKNGTLLELWTSDYIPRNTEMVASFPGALSASVGEVMTLDDEHALFTASQPDYGVELWKFIFPEVKARSPTRSPSSPTRSPTTRSPTQTFQSAAPMQSVGLAFSLGCLALAMIVA